MCREKVFAPFRFFVCLFVCLFVFIIILHNCHTSKIQIIKQIVILHKDNASI